MTTTMSGEDIRRRLTQTGVTQADIAARLGMWEPKLSRILNGRDPMPEGFAADFERALRAVARERAEAAGLRVEDDCAAATSAA
jgi:transcriptional regulator with XRE-family HTH domain